MVGWEAAVCVRDFGETPEWRDFMHFAAVRAFRGSFFNALVSLIQNAGFKRFVAGPLQYRWAR